jgi:hypothetical protein
VSGNGGITAHLIRGICVHPWCDFGFPITSDHPIPKQCHPCSSVVSFFFGQKTGPALLPALFVEVVVNV